MINRNSIKSDWILLLLGGLFLWEPTVGVREFLPDFIGYLFLLLGIARFADLNDSLAEAQRGFRCMLWVGFARIAAVLFVKYVLDDPEVTLNRYERPVWILVFAFVFLVAELYYLLPAWRSFFQGFESLAVFHGGRNVSEEKNGRTVGSRLMGFTQWLVLLKAILAVLPEATVLTSFEKDAENPMFTFDWYTYVDTFRSICAVVVAVFGAVWLIRYLRYCHLARKDQDWQECLQGRYNTDILPDTGLLLNRRVGAAFSFFRIGMVFTANLAISHFDFLPDWLSVLLFFCGWMVLDSLRGRSVGCVLTGILLLLVGGGRSYFNVVYLKSYVPKDAWNLPGAYEAYLPVRLLGWAEAVLCFCLVVFLLGALLRMMREHTGVDYGANAEALSRDATERLHRSMKRRSISVYAFSAVSAICKILEIELRHSLEWIWLVQLAVSVAAWIFFSAFLSELAEKTAERYPVRKRA